MTNDGLNKFNRKENNFTKYATDSGFPSNVTYRLLEDKFRKLWVSTSKGLVHFDPVTEDIKVYTKAHGLPSDQLNYSSSFKDENGRMYFGTVKGLIRFNQEEFIQNDHIPPIYITGFQIHNLELPVRKENSPLDQSIISSEKIALNYDQSSFSLDFAALSYATPQMTVYAYKMEGLDKEWTFLTTNRRVFYTELPPGEYIFKVKAQNSSGIWTEIHGNWLLKFFLLFG